MVAPTKPPINAWVEELGMPKYHVAKPQMMADSNAPINTYCGRCIPVVTIPFEIVEATFSLTSAPRQFRVAAIATAILGLSTRVETDVAMELAVS